MLKFSVKLIIHQAGWWLAGGGGGPRGDVKQCQCEVSDQEQPASPAPFTQHSHWALEIVPCML